MTFSWAPPLPPPQWSWPSSRASWWWDRCAPGACSHRGRNLSWSWAAWPLSLLLPYLWNVLCKPHDNHRAKIFRDTNIKKRGDWTNHHGKPPTYKGRQKQKEKVTMEKQNNQKEKNKITVVNPHISITPLKGNGLNSIKRQSVAEVANQEMKTYLQKMEKLKMRRVQPQMKQKKKKPSLIDIIHTPCLISGPCVPSCTVQRNIFF